MKTILDPELCWRVLLTLGHFLWQGAVIGLVAAVVAWMLRRASARARYGVWVTALFLMTLCPVGTFIHLSATAGGAPMFAVISEEASAAPGARNPAVLPSMTEGPISAGSPAATAPPSVAVPALPEGVDWKRFAPHAMAAYLLGVALMFGRLLLALNGAVRLRRASAPVTDPVLLEMIARRSRAMRLRFVPAVEFCKEVLVPTVVGLFRPVILLPVAFAAGLSPGQVEAILVHELEHIRRHDFVVNLFQRMAEAALFFHPAIWLVSRRIRIEREHCCDDAVVTTGCEPLSYAESLVAQAERALAARTGRCTAAGAALYADGGSNDLSDRVARILRIPEGGEIRLRIWPVALVGLVALSIATTHAVNKEKKRPVKHSIGIHLITGSSKDVPFDKTPLADLTLVDEALINQDDISRYDWESHTIHLKTQAAANRILYRKEPDGRRVVSGSFVVVVDGQRLYRGAMRSMMSSHIPDAPIIHIGPGAGQHQPELAIRIHPPRRGAPDPRGDARLKKALQDMLLMPMDVAQPAEKLGEAVEIEITAEGDLPPASPPPAAITIDFESETMQNIIGAQLRQKGSVRLCLEHLDYDMTRDGITIAQAIRQLEETEKKRKLTPKERDRLLLARKLLAEGHPKTMLFDVGSRYSGHFQANSVDELLTQITRDTPYAWRKIGDTFVVLPAAGTRLGYPVTLATKGLTVAQAVQKVVAQQPADSQISMISIAGMPVKEGEDPMPWLSAKAPVIELKGIPALEALCRITAGARPDSIWELAGYKEARHLGLSRGPNATPASAAVPPASPPAGSRLEFRIAPRPDALDGAELRSCMGWLKAGRVGFWWKGGPLSGRMPNHAWLPITGDLSNAGQLVTAEYGGRKYVLVSDKSGQVMKSGEGGDAWGLAMVSAATSASGQPVVRFVLDDHGAELFAALTKANINKALAMVVDGKVVSAPVLMTALGRQGMITGRFTDQEVKDLVEVLKTPTPANPPANAKPAPKPSSQNEEKLKSSLPSGTAIELVAVSNYPDKNAPWWRPDGMPLATPPIDPSDIDIRSFYDPKLRAIELVFRLGGKADRPAYDSQIRGSDGQRVLWTGRRTRDGKIAADLMVVSTHVPVDSKTVGLNLLIAAGPWETVASSDGRQAAGPLGSATLGDRASSSGPSTVITARFDPDKRDAQVIGIDANGVEHVVRDFEIRRGANDVVANFLFAGLTPGQFKSFTLQTRPNDELIRLTDVSLVPGQRTDARLKSGTIPL